MNKLINLNLLDWILRLNVCLKLFMYGLGKILGGQFYLKGAVPDAIAKTPLGETFGYDLAWTFFGYSKPYIIFIGGSQLVGAALLMINKTKLLGGAMLVPILMNIIMVDYFYGVAYGAMFSACFYLASILFMFYLNRKQLAEVLSGLLVNATKTMERNQKWTQLVLIVVGMVIIFFVEYFFINIFGYEDRYY